MNPQQFLRAVRQKERDDGGALKADGQGQNIDPCGDLFIYHLQGRVHAADELALGEQFLGNWVAAVKYQAEEWGFSLHREWDHEMTWYTMLMENKRLK